MESEVTAEGAIPLIPIQHWFFEQRLAVLAQWSQVCLLDIEKWINTKILQQCFQKLLAHHDALRIRFYQEENMEPTLYR